MEALVAQGRGGERVAGGGCTEPGGGIAPTTRTARETAALLRQLLVLRSAPRPALSAVELPPVEWKQVGVGLVIGLGLGYVLFASK